jgi:hypothetical protein
VRDLQPLYTSPPPSGNAELTKRLRSIITAFDDEVAEELSSEGERADLWTEVDVPIELLREAASHIERIEAERDEAVKALEPFAEVGDIMVPLSEGDDSPWVTASDETRYAGQGLTFGDFRRAAAIRSRTQGKTE